MKHVILPEIKIPSYSFTAEKVKFVKETATVMIHFLQGDEKLNNIYLLNKWAFYNKGYILLVEYELFDEAADAFQQALNIDPSFVDAVYNLGRTYEAQGLYEEAVVKYRQALELETNYPLAIDGLNRLGQ